ncbi:MAG: hypothetical protein IH987_03685 [Planctomycetes bacterium]|nr:hypothetical protein [Planctomycetota bacterium]
MKQLISRTRQLVRSTRKGRWVLVLAAIGLSAATLVALDFSLHESEALALRDGAPQAKPVSKTTASPVVTSANVSAVPDVDAPADPRDRGLDSRVPRATRSRMVGPPIGGSIWVSQGPGPAQFGQIENVLPDNEVVGAVHCLAAHPVNADILYLGGVNGGVWKTTNATAISPTWVPLTDLENGLSTAPSNSTRPMLHIKRLWRASVATAVSVVPGPSALEFSARPTVEPRGSQSTAAESF